MSSETEQPKFKVFRYVRKLGNQGLPMCPHGQRTATAEAWDLFNAGGEQGKQRMLERAVLAEKQLKEGITIAPSQYISWIVIELFCAGLLKEYADKYGNYTLEEGDRKKRKANVFKDIKKGRTFYPIVK